MSKYIVDVDGTICNNTNGNYHISQPIQHRIDHFNSLYDQGHEIHYWTARGGNSGKDWHDVTLEQLKSWGAKFTSFNTKKPVYDHWIDDKAENVDHYFERILKDK